MQTDNGTVQVDTPGYSGAWIKQDWRLATLRLGMRALGWISPGLATLVMDRLWFSAPRSRPRPEARCWLESGERLSIEVQGRRIAAWSWGAGPAVILLHGWGGNAGQMHAFVSPLLRAGLKVVAFDAPAHGASESSQLGGRRVTFFEFAEALRAVAAQVGQLVGVIAHSGGCTATTLAMRQGWTAPSKIAFVSPFTSPSAAIGSFARTLGFGARVVDRFKVRVERQIGHPWSVFDITNVPPQTQHQTLLVVHDKEDREVPYDDGRAVESAWPQAQLMTTSGLGHRRILQDETVLSRVVDFITSG